MISFNTKAANPDGVDPNPDPTLDKNLIPIWPLKNNPDPDSTTLIYGCKIS